MAEPPYPQWLEYLCYAMVAAAFTLFAGGSWKDALASLVIGVFLKSVIRLNGFLQFNRVFTSMIASFFVSLLAFLTVRFAWGDSVDTIVIGNIMLQIPGVALTNSLRDMISGDTMSGILRFCEACIVALAIAAGYVLAGFALGGVL